MSKWGHSAFWPDPGSDPGDVVHFDVIFPLIQKLRLWSKKVILITVKSHAGCFLNEMADERAEEGRLSDAPIFPGPNKYGSLQLRIEEPHPSRHRCGQLKDHHGCDQER